MMDNDELGFELEALGIGSLLSIPTALSVAWAERPVSGESAKKIGESLQEAVQTAIHDAGAVVRVSLATLPELDVAAAMVRELAASEEGAKNVANVLHSGARLELKNGSAVFLSRLKVFGEGSGNPR